MNYEAGKRYPAMLSDGPHTFTVLEEEISPLDTDVMHIVWDDGEKEDVYVKDADRWVEEAKEIEDINNYASIFDLESMHKIGLASILNNGRFTGFAKETL